MKRAIITLAAGLFLGQMAPYAATAAGWESIQPSARIWLRKVDPESQNRRSDAERPWVNGSVRKVDVADGALTFRHAAIARAKMPAMTMTLPVKDATHLSTMKRGDKIAVQVADDGGVVRVVNVRMLH